MYNPEPFTPPARGKSRDGLASLMHVHVPAGKVELEAELVVPVGARGLVLFAHGGGAGLENPRHQRTAQALRRRGLGTLLFDALTRAERRQDATDERLRFDIGLLARRLGRITDWARGQSFGDLPIGYLGASAGAAAAIVAAAERPESVRALVCRGKPELAGSALGQLRAPTLLLVGSQDRVALASNELARSRMRDGVAQIQIVPGAGHLFEEPGVLGIVSELAGSWFTERLARPPHPSCTS